MSKKMEISALYRVSVANVSNESEGDFLDALSNDPNANSYYFAVCDEATKVIAYHVETGNLVIDTGSIDEAVEEFLRFPFEGGYEEPILKPMLLAAIHNSTEVLAEAFDIETFRFYSVSEMDDVTEYKSKIEALPLVCGFGAVSYNTGAHFDLDSRKLTFDNESFDNLSDLTGYFDEEAWVVVLRPYQTGADETPTPSEASNENSDGRANQFCSECGGTLEADAKFCTHCGTKVSLADSRCILPLPELQNNPLTNNKLNVKVSSIEVEGPDTDRNYSITVKYAVNNDLDDDLCGLSSHVFLFNGDGALLDERSTNTDSLASGGFSDYETYFWSVPEAYVGESVKDLSIIIEATGYKEFKRDVEALVMPQAAHEVGSLTPLDIDNKVRLISGSFWKSAQDGDEGVDINIKCAIQNLTDDPIAKVRLSSSIIGKDGEEILNMSASEAIRPASLAVLVGGAYENNKALEGARIESCLMYELPIAQNFTTHKGAVLTHREADDDSDIYSTPAFTALAATLGNRNPNKNSDDDLSIDMAPIACHGSFELNVIGRGGETVVGTITKKQFDYWAEHTDELAEHIAGEGSVADEVSLVEWSDHDDIAHRSGAEFTAESTRISVTDANGTEIWSVDADQDALIDHGIDVELVDEIAIYQQEPGYYFCGRAFEKGSFFSAIVEADEFDPKKLKFALNSVNEWLLLDGIYYEAEELDGSDGYNTSTYSSEFFVEESES